MPEGDTIHRAAQTLHRALAGKTVTRFETALAPLARVDDQEPIAGRTIVGVAAAGKHLLMRFSGGLTLRTHMRMNGSWHIYRPNERWRMPRIDMRVVVATDDFVAVGFNVPVAEFLDERQLVRQNDLRRIGPDFLGETFDENEALRRMRERGDRAIAEVLLNQRVVAGVGNVFKSEVLFVERVSPFARVDSLSDAKLRELLAAARKVMQVNVRQASGSRRTHFGLDPRARLWVYGRDGQPCRTCGTPIERIQQGRDARLTFWCPRCQPTP